MAELKFDDGAEYERVMGVWSWLVGPVFLDWIAPKPGLSWLDVGCGNGAFTQLIVERCQPREVRGVDPSEGQLAYARTRGGAEKAQFQQGNATDLPFADNSFDAATMALVLFFVPQPQKGVAEMRRVVKRGGVVAAYAWDMFGGGLPQEAIFKELRALGHEPVAPPSPEASKSSVMQELWKDAGIKSIETRAIRVERTFHDFDEFWGAVQISPSIKACIANMSQSQTVELQERTRKRLPVSANGSITYNAWANAVKGVVSS